jgi:RNA-directed DNA polymerase
MKKSHGKELATHTDLESCGVTCKGNVEALTEARAGRVFSRERRILRDADGVGERGRHHPLHRYREKQRNPARSQTPCTYGSTSQGNREIPRSPGAEFASGRIGKSKDTRR